MEQKIEIKTTNIFNLGTIKDKTIGHEPSLIKGLLRRKQKMAISAPKTSLKTSLVIHLALSIVTERFWLDWQCTKGKVMYVNLNLSENECVMRFNLAISQLNIVDIGLDFIDIMTISGGISINDLIKEIIQTSQDKNYRCIIIDSLDDVMISNNSWSNESVLKKFNELIETLNCCLVFTESHSHKPVGNQQARENAEWSESLKYSDILLEFIKLELDPELLRQERLAATWKYFKDIMLAHAKSYF